MPPRKGKFSAYALFRWFYRHLAIILGITPYSPRTRRLLTKRCHRKAQELVNSTTSKRKYRPSSTELSELTISNRQLAYNNWNMNSLSEVDQGQIFCLLFENRKIVESLQRLLTRNCPSMLKESRMIELQELIQVIQTTTTNKPREDASTMTDTDLNTSCASLIAQSENVRRLKALEFIRRFLGMKKEDFCQHLINEEHLCPQKTQAIYQMIAEFLRVVYQSEYEETIVENFDRY